ncbi:hypothetical protein [Actinomadura sp. BRA 177]|uniref:hypothetical protein n=1 Tax=Actinomadura sp. BRA 177 TaxID=2745202 RepID=UPI00159545FF|nr:hypothetical protein [Actinomadura sp. BRA 177]NVI90211.1 hypothetical protein [Actinomadura sp. BRA 177]
MRSLLITLAGTAIGTSAGALWGYYGSGGYESSDSAIGTGLMGAIVGLVAGAVAATIGRANDRRPPDNDP